VKIRFYIDDDSGLPHCLRHQVTEEEVRYAMPRRLKDRAGSNGARVAFGQTSTGRYLKIVYVRDPGQDSVFIITAYTMKNPAAERRGINHRAAGI
jgi:hypothetical protein